MRVESKKELVIAEYDCWVVLALKLAGREDGTSDLASRSRHRLRLLLVVFSLSLIHI